jgi:hypothetical protein
MQPQCGSAELPLNLGRTRMVELIFEYFPGHCAHIDSHRAFQEQNIIYEKNRYLFTNCMAGRMALHLIKLFFFWSQMITTTLLKDVQGAVCDRPLRDTIAER